MKVYRITCKATIAVAVVVRRSLQLKLAFVAFKLWLRSGLVSMGFGFSNCRDTRKGCRYRGARWNNVMDNCRSGAYDFVDLAYIGRSFARFVTSNSVDAEAGLRRAIECDDIDGIIAK